MIELHISMKKFRQIYEQFLDEKYPRQKNDELFSLPVFFRSAYAIILYETGDILLNYNTCSTSKRGYDLIGQICETITHEVFHDIFQREQLKEYERIHDQWDRLTLKLVAKGDYLGGQKVQTDIMTRKLYKGGQTI